MRRCVARHLACASHHHRPPRPATGSVQANRRGTSTVVVRRREANFNMSPPNLEFPKQGEIRAPAPPTSDAPDDTSTHQRPGLCQSLVHPTWSAMEQNWKTRNVFLVLGPATNIRQLKMQFLCRASHSPCAMRRQSMPGLRKRGDEPRPPVSPLSPLAGRRKQLCLVDKSRRKEANNGLVLSNKLHGPWRPLLRMTRMTRRYAQRSGRRFALPSARLHIDTA